jgi:hypothetical protein
LIALKTEARAARVSKGEETRQPRTDATENSAVAAILRDGPAGLLRMRGVLA